MHRTAALFALGTTILPAFAATTYTIDPSQSHVSAYVPRWVQGAEVFTGGSLPGEPLPPPTYEWSVQWELAQFSVSGTFDVEVMTSPYYPPAGRLFLGNANISTSAPAYAAFSLPPVLSLAPGGALNWSSQACYDDGYFTAPGTFTYCTGMNFGPIRQDGGNSSGGSLALGGDQPVLILGMMFVQSQVEPPPVTDFSPVAGGFAYSIQAVAVPEPETWATMLAGLGLLGWVARRRSGR